MFCPLFLILINYTCGINMRCNKSYGTCWIIRKHLVKIHYRAMVWFCNNNLTISLCSVSSKCISNIHFLYNKITVKNLKSNLYFNCTYFKATTNDRIQKTILRQGQCNNIQYRYNRCTLNTLFYIIVTQMIHVII